MQDMKHYKWSSYHKYFNKNESTINTEFIQTYFKSIKEFEIFMEEKNDDECLDYNPTKRWMDDELAEYINQIFNVTEIHNLDKGSRNETPRTIKNKTGASNRQLSRILGIGRGVLEKIN